MAGGTPASRSSATRPWAWPWWAVASIAVWAAGARRRRRARSGSPTARDSAAAASALVAMSVAAHPGRAAPAMLHRRLVPPSSSSASTTGIRSWSWSGCMSPSRTSCGPTGGTAWRSPAGSALVLFFLGGRGRRRGLVVTGEPRRASPGSAWPPARRRRPQPPRLRGRGRGAGPPGRADPRGGGPAPGRRGTAADRPGAARRGRPPHRGGQRAGRRRRRTCCRPARRRRSRRWTTSARASEHGAEGDRILVGVLRGRTAGRAPPSRPRRWPGSPELLTSFGSAAGCGCEAPAARRAAGVAGVVDLAGVPDRAGVTDQRPQATATAPARRTVARTPPTEPA